MIHFENLETAAERSAFVERELAWVMTPDRVRQNALAWDAARKQRRLHEAALLEDGIDLLEMFAERGAAERLESAEDREFAEIIALPPRKRQDRVCAMIAGKDGLVARAQDPPEPALRQDESTGAKVLEIIQKMRKLQSELTWCDDCAPMLGEYASLDQRRTIMALLDQAQADLDKVARCCNPREW